MSKTTRVKLYLSLFLILIFSILGLTLIYAQENPFSLIPGSSSSITKGVQVPDSNPLTQAGRLSKDKYNFGVIKFQYGSSGQPIQAWASTAKNLGYEVMVSFAKNHTGFTLPSEVVIGDECPGGYGIFSQYVEQKARDLGNSVNLYEIWNEPNLLSEWDESKLGPVNGAKYAKLLQCGAKGVKAGNPNAKVISAGLSPAPLTNPDVKVLAQDFFNQMKTSGVDLSQVDYYGVHLYSNQNLDPSDGNNSIHEIRFYAEEEKRLYVTEFGWNRCDAQISVEKQKEYIDKAFGVMSSQYPAVKGMVVWNFGFTQALNPGSDFSCYNIEGGETSTTINVGAAGKLAASAEPQPYFLLSNAGGTKELKYIPKAPTPGCQPNRTTASQGKSRNDAIYAPSLENETREYGKNDLLSRALNPDSLNADIKDKTLRPQQTKTAVERNFVQNIAFNFGLCNLVRLEFCSANVEVANNTERAALQAQLLAESDLPTDMKLIPEENDCNIADLEQTEGNKGNQDLNKLSVFSGKNTGNPSLPGFADYQKRLEECKQRENLTLDGTQFVGDARTCDIDLANDAAMRAQFPDGVNPFPENNHGYIDQ